MPGIKSDADEFETRGHKSRVVDIRLLELDLFARLFDQSGTPPLEARLPVVHSSYELSVLRKLAGTRIDCATSADGRLEQGCGMEQCKKTASCER